MTERRSSTWLEIVLPFIIFTGIWGSTWIVIRDQLGIVPPQWSVSYRFVIAAMAMAIASAGTSSDSRCALGDAPASRDLARTTTLSHVELRQTPFENHTHSP